MIVLVAQFIPFYMLPFMPERPEVLLTGETAVHDDHRFAVISLEHETADAGRKILKDNFVLFHLLRLRDESVAELMAQICIIRRKVHP